MLLEKTFMLEHCESNENDLCPIQICPNSNGRKGLPLKVCKYCPTDKLCKG